MKAAQPTMMRIARVIPHPHKNDGSVFRNADGLLPLRGAGWYTEYVAASIYNKAGLWRLVRGLDDSLWYSFHYYRFWRLF